MYGLGDESRTRTPLRREVYNFHNQLVNFDDADVCEYAR